MVRINFRFDREKATEVILYLASKATVPNIYGICKLLYLADKTHLSKYGRFIFGDNYVAMRAGGTPSNAYDLLKEVRKNPTSVLRVEDNFVVALREPDLDYLSQSDIECLDQVIEEYGEPSDWTKMRDACHDAAWQKAWDNRGIHRSRPISVESIVQLFDNSDELIDYLFNSG
jgi:uncharacterized phage-associated protein